MVDQVHGDDNPRPAPRAMTDTRPVAPIAVAHLLAPLHDELIALLRSLAPEDWSRPTWAPAWTVKDVAAHLLDGQIRKLSICRDGWRPSAGAGAPPAYADLVTFLDGLNAEWVASARRIGPRVLVDLLAVIGPQDAAYLASLDPDAEACFGVAWAGDEASPNWFDVGREYTERWHHQQQIREAVGAPGLLARRWLHPVLDVSVRALPHAYREVAAVDGSAVVFEITGEAGDTWSLVRDVPWPAVKAPASDPRPAARGAWRLHAGARTPASARVTMSADTAWRLFFTAEKGAEIAAGVRVEGDQRLGLAVMHALAVMA